MLIKNKKIIIIFLVNLLLVNINVYADEFDITAKEIVIDKENEIIIGKGTVKAQDSNGNIIYGDKITYEKQKEFLLAEGNVVINDKEGNILKTDRATFDKLNNLIHTYNKTNVKLKEGYKLEGTNVLYQSREKIVYSNESSILTDADGNVIKTSMFQYDVLKSLFSSIGKIEIIDISRNKYFFKELHIDTGKKEMIGSDVSVVLDQQNFGVSKESDPRFVANDILISNNQAKLSKGVFTVCKKREDKCPPWTLKAKEILYDAQKKNIYYKNATLKVYDIPIFYFPRFFHPDPTVKRQSGFLFPFFTNTTTTGNGLAVPYYWAISNDKDFTFTPKFYQNENLLFLNEYRQALNNGFLTLDSGYTQGFKNTSKTKTKGSQNHIFANLDLFFNKNETYENSLSLKVQRTNNDTYFKKHSINTALVDPENSNLINEIKYSFSNENMYFNITGNMYEDLNKDTSSRYEYVLPNILYGKTFFSDNFGAIDFKSNAFYNNYDTNKYKAFLVNDIIWTPFNKVTKGGLVNTFEGMVRNTNYETKKTGEYKDGGKVNELNAVLSYKSSLPLKKDGINYSNLFSPNLMVRIAPGHMRNLNSDDVSLNYSNLYSLNKTSEIEDGLSAILGFDFKSNEKLSNNDSREKFSLSLGQVFNNKRNKKIPSKSSLDQKMSDVVGAINYNFSEIGNINYKFSVDHNLENLNYNEISTGFNFGLVKFNLDYLEENKHIGKEHYVSSEISLDFNKNNKLSLSTKKNFKTESTEFYNLSYQYAIDCLTAGVAYRREFYQDSDLEPNNTLMFTMTFVPFATVNTPALNQ